MKINTIISTVDAKSGEYLPIDANKCLPVDADENKQILVNTSQIIKKKNKYHHMHSGSKKWYMPANKLQMNSNHQSTNN